MALNRLQFLLLLAAIGLLVGQTASAQTISPQNPYRSYNLSGVNYGSQQWEKDHARAKSNPQPVQQKRFPIFQRQRLRRF